VGWSAFACSDPAADHDLRLILSRGRAVLEPPSAGVLDEYYGLAVGLDFGRYLGAELAVEGYEVAMGLKGVGSIVEYAIYTFIPQLRVAPSCAR
jgi:hypothetical protein